MGETWGGRQDETCFCCRVKVEMRCRQNLWKGWYADEKEKWWLRQYCNWIFGLDCNFCILAGKTAEERLMKNGRSV